MCYNVLIEIFCFILAKSLSVEVLSFGKLKWFYLHESHSFGFSKLIKQLLKTRGSMRKLSKLAVRSCADCYVFMVLVTVSNRWTFNQFEHPMLSSGKTITQSIINRSHKASDVLSADFCRDLLCSLSSLSSQPLAAFGRPSCGLAWSQVEGGTWKQTPGRPETPNCCMLALAGVSSGLQAAEKATIWLHGWANFIHIFLQLCHYYDNGPWLPYLQALIQEPLVLFGTQAVCRAWGHSKLKITVLSNQWHSMEIHALLLWIILLC